MKKIICVLMGVTSVASSVLFIYGIYSTSDMSVGALLGALFISLVSGVLFIMLENRPKTTPAQVRRDKSVLNQGFGLLMLLALAFILIASMSSCKTTGYGCKGKSKWITGHRPNGY